MLPPERRLGRVLRLIESRKYFTLHAGRQTGKTTSARWLVEHLNREGRFRALWVDVQIARDEPDPARSFEAVLYALDAAVDRDLPDLGRPADEVRRIDPRNSFILRYLRDLAKRSDKPLVVLFDEADGLVGATMISFLTQLRQGYLDRSRIPFPSSVALIGQRQVRDYALATEERRVVAWLGTTSPFNITAEAMTLGHFTEPEIAELLGQHTAATGQMFEPEAVRRIWELGQGHPWLTNALADQIAGRDVEVICWREDRHAIEVKIRRDTETEAEAFDQVARYLDHAGLGEGWLVMFDLRKDRSWAEKLFVREVAHAGKTVRLVGC